MEHAGMRSEGGDRLGRPEWSSLQPPIPLVVRDDAVPEPLDEYAPSFLRGTERPVRLAGEDTFAAVPGCSVILSSRVAGTLSWLDAWRSPARCTITVSCARVVFAVRPYRDQPGHPQAGKVIGGGLGYPAVNRVGIWIAPGDGDSHLLVYGRDEQRQWRLAIGSPDLTQEGPQLAEELAAAVACRRLAMRLLEHDVVGQLSACAEGVRLRPAPGHGVTVTLPGEVPMPGAGFAG